MANIYSDKTEDWTYYNTTRLDVHSFRFNGVGAYATTVIGNGGGEDTEQELGGELVFRGVVSPAQSSLSQGLRCRIDIYSKQDAEQENWETESHFIYIKGDRNGAINQKVNVRNGAYDHINLKIEVLSDAEMSLDNTIDLTSFIIHDAALIADLSVIREKIEEGETGLSTLEEETLNLFNVISGSLGFYSTVVEHEDGSKISYIHDKPKLENSMVIAAQTENGWASTTTGWNDGEPAWTYGVTFDGSLVMNVVSAVGINADWIKAGKITASQMNVSSLSAISANLGNITGGSINIGSGKFQVSNEGLLTATGADIGGVLNSTSGNIGGFALSSNGLTASIYEKFGPFTQSDVTWISNFYLSGATPTEAELKKYDINRDGRINMADATYIQYMLNGTYPNPWYVEFILELNTGDSADMIKISSPDLIHRKPIALGLGKIQTEYITAPVERGVTVVGDSFVANTTDAIELTNGKNTANEHSLGVNTSGAYYSKGMQRTYFEDMPRFAIQYGTAEVSTTANTTVSKAVSFSSAFSSAPTVLLTMGGTAPQRFQISSHDITTSGFNIYVRDTNTSTAYVRWLAIL